MVHVCGEGEPDERAIAMIAGIVDLLDAAKAKPPSPEPEKGALPDPVKK